MGLTREIVKFITRASEVDERGLDDARRELCRRLEEFAAGGFFFLLRPTSLEDEYTESTLEIR